MATPTLESIIEQIDQLSIDDQHKIVDHITQQRKISTFEVSAEVLRPIRDLFEPMQAEIAEMDEDELNDFIRDVVEEVRQEHYDMRGY